MTTLTQSELDDLLLDATKLGASAFIRLRAIERLVNHIARLTAERDEAQRLAATHFINKTVVERELNAATARSEQEEK